MSTSKRQTYVVTPNATKTGGRKVRRYRGERLSGEAYLASKTASGQFRRLSTRQIAQATFAS